MPVIVIDKIKAATSGFKPLDYIDINGRITGWQNPVKNIFADIAGITGLTNGDFFIVRNITGEWAAFTGLDIYGNEAVKTNNAIYFIGEAVDGGEALPVYLVTAPATGMMLIDLNSGNLKKYAGTLWSDFVVSGSGGISGQSLRYSTELTVLVGINYNTSTHHLTIMTGENTLQSGDNVNIYVNGLKYSHIGSDNAFAFEAGENYVVWIPTNAGFELIDDDYIEVEIFNNE